MLVYKVVCKIWTGQTSQINDCFRQVKQLEVIHKYTTKVYDRYVPEYSYNEIQKVFTEKFNGKILKKT